MYKMPDPPKIPIHVLKPEYNYTINVTFAKLSDCVGPVNPKLKNLKKNQKKQK